MKKTVSVFLALIMIFSCILPAAAAEDAEEIPTVYVIGAHKNDIYNADGKTIYPIEADLGATIKEALLPCLSELAMGMLTDDFSGYAEEFNSSMAPIYEELILDKNGNVTNGSYTRFHYTTENFPKKDSGYGVWDYRFWYDWRLSPTDTAAELKDCIDRVIEVTGKDKVQIIGRCFGANVIASYLELYKDHAKEFVSDVSYYSSSVMGIDFMSALFSGDVYLDETALNNFLDYYVYETDLISDETAGELIVTLVEILRQVQVLGLTGDAFVNFFNMFKGDLLPLILRNSFAGWLSYWSMVTPEKYEQARDFVFNTDELKKEYTGFIEKADKYYYTVQLNAESTMKELREAGINFYNFTKYNYPEIPLYEGASAQGDADTSVFRQSFGATAADYNTVFSEDYLAAVAPENRKYISPDLKIDASTCLFPERTWFIKDLHHDFFGPLQNVSMEIMRYDMTVESGRLPQFVTHIGNNDDTNGENLIPTVGTDEDADKIPNSIIHSAMRFITALINLFTKLLKEEFNLSLNLDAIR
ncbi:MAG: hypothetical protein IJN88_08155 [Clostridia bacterium]|nr:hypothetical protein [Clostridia bacterium]